MAFVGGLAGVMAVVLGLGVGIGVVLLGSCLSRYLRCLRNAEPDYKEPEPSGVVAVATQKQQQKQEKQQKQEEGRWLKGKAKVVEEEEVKEHEMVVTRGEESV